MAGGAAGGAAGRGAAGRSVVALAALAGILLLLAMLCCYACYYFVTKIRELSRADLTSPTPTPAKRRAPPAYPVQPEVREGATAMAALCRQLPLPGAPAAQGDQVFPAARSPDPRPALAGPPPGTPAAPQAAPTGPHIAPAALAKGPIGPTAPQYHPVAAAH